MAINPEISLGVRPPILQPLQIQDPLERYAKVQTLRQLMQQGQLRELQTQQAQQELAQARQDAEREGEFRQRVMGGESLTPAQSLGILGPKAGSAYLKSQAEIAAENAKRERTQEERQENYLRMIGQAALNSKNQQDRDFRINALSKAGVIPQELATQMLAAPFDLAETQAYGQMTMSAAEQMREQREAAARAFAEKKQPFELRTAEAQAQTAEQTAAGTQPVKPAVPPALMPPDVEAQQARLRQAGAPRFPSPGMTPEAEAQTIRIAKATQEGRPPTAVESQAMGFYTRLQDAEDVFSGLEKNVKDMGTVGQTWFKYGPNFLQPADNQVLQQAQRQFTEARLRKESGAAIAAHEFANDARMYFPQPGDTPQNLERKKRAREVLIGTFKQQAGRADKGRQENPQPGAPAVGTVEGGYRFKGGDASKPENWEKQ